jgi:trehalose 6-phosphate phosphatase
MASACRDAALRAAALAGDALELIEGKMLVEVRPHEANKGQAIATLLSEPPFRGRVPVFIGDDRTDEDGFVVVNSMGGLSIQVGQYTDTAARHGISDVNGVLAWLTASLGQNPPGTSPPEAC